MGIRGVLQTEIWTTETSRKIYRVVVKTFAFVGLAFVCIVIWHVVNRVWLTRWERRPAQAALLQLDALQYLDSLSDEEYGARYKQAQGNVHAAEQAAWTGRDKSVAVRLSSYLMYTDLRRSELKFELKLNAANDDRSRKYESMQSRSRTSSLSVIALQSEVLHAELE